MHTQPLTPARLKSKTVAGKRVPKRQTAPPAPLPGESGRLEQFRGPFRIRQIWKEGGRIAPSLSNLEHNPELCFSSRRLSGELSRPPARLFASHSPFAAPHQEKHKEHSGCNPNNRRKYGFIHANLLFHLINYNAQLPEKHEHAWTCGHNHNRRHDAEKDRENQLYADFSCSLFCFLSAPHA